MSKTEDASTTPAPLPAEATASKRTKPEVSAPAPTPKSVKRALTATAAKAADPKVQAIRQAVRAQGDMNTEAQAKPPRRMSEQFRRREYDTAGRETAS